MIAPKSRPYKCPKCGQRYTAATLRSPGNCTVCLLADAKMVPLVAVPK